MVVRRSNNAFAPFCVAAIAAGLVGCAPSPTLGPDPSPTTSRQVMVEPIEVSHFVHFETDSAQLSATEGEGLERFLESLERLSLFAIKVAGHADERASDAYNLELAARRARHVATIIKNAKLDRVDVEMMALGEQVPSSTAEGPEGWKRDRRVEVVASVAKVAVPGCSGDGPMLGSEIPGASSEPLGCASARNLARMLADPRDLAGGGELGPPDPTHQSEAVRRYRRNEVELSQPETQRQ